MRNEMPGVSVEVPGVHVRIEGWVCGLNKVRLTKLFRAGGNDLRTASKMTEEVLAGRAVCVRLAHFASMADARRALLEIGVAHVRPLSEGQG